MKITRALKDREYDLMTTSLNLRGRTLGESNMSIEGSQRLFEAQDKAYKRWKFYKDLRKTNEKLKRRNGD